MEQAIWARGRVPHGYWSIRANRVRYMTWLGRRLGYRRVEDWYGLTRRAFLKNHGGGLLATVYRHSPLEALKDYRPDYDWKPWLLASTPQAYWKNRRNRIRYMAWLGEQLKFKRIEDWYGLTQRHFQDHGGGGLLAIYYANSPQRALKEFKPRVAWHEWLFPATPQGFWKRKENRKRYMAWLGKQLGYRKPEDWYHITRRDFYDHGGGALFNARRDSSPRSLLKEYLPNHNWNEWLFPRVPNGFWRRRENRRRYIEWLGRQLGFRRYTDWYELTSAQVRATGGGTLLSQYYRNSLIRMLRDLLPQYKWNAQVLYARDKKSKGKLPLKLKRLAA